MTRERERAVLLTLQGIDKIKEECEDTLYRALVDFGFRKARNEPLNCTKETILTMHRGLLAELDAIRKLIIERQEA